MEKAAAAGNSTTNDNEVDGDEVDVPTGGWDKEAKVPKEDDVDDGK